MAPSNARVATRGPADTPQDRRDRAAFDDPSTPEQYLMRCGLREPADFTAAMSRPTKSPAMLSVLIGFVGADRLERDQGRAAILSLLGEAELDHDGLQHLARIANSYGLNSGGVLRAICCHRTASTTILIGALWNAGNDAAADVATRTGTLMPAVIAWVRTRQHGTGCYSQPTIADREQIAATRQRWTTWAAGNQARVAYLTHSWRSFTNEDTMLEVGHALTAAPNPG